MLTLMWLAAATAVGVSDPNTDPWLKTPYVNGDPYYSAEYEQLEDCVQRTSSTYRFDYDRPDVTAMRQAADHIRSVCAEEVAAVKKLMAPFESSDDPDDITGGLDGFFIAPYFDAGRLPGARSARQLDINRQPNETERGPDFRTSYLPVAVGLRPAEVVAVLRWADSGGESGAPPFGFTYFGKIDGWDYAYQYHHGSWLGSVSRREDHAEIECWVGDGAWIRNPSKLCDIRVGYSRPLKGDGLLSLKAGSAPFRVLLFCNPGHVQLSDVIVRPPPPPDSPMNVARDGRISIDGETPVAIPNTGCLKDVDGNLTKRLLAANHVHSTYVPRFDTRTITRGGSPKIVAPAIALAAHMHRITFNAAAATNARADLETLWRRSRPFTLQDALPQRPEWSGVMRCLLRARRTAPDADQTKTLERALVSECRDQLQDLEWRAAGLNDSVSSLEPPDKSPAHAERASAARRMILDAASNASATTQPEQAFADEERIARVMGRQGKVGVAVEFSNRGSSTLQEYGYALAADAAVALIPSMQPHTFSYAAEEQAVRSITINCTAVRESRCEIAIPTDDGKGAFLVKTNGALHGAALCVRYEGADFRNWRLAGDEYTKIEFKLSPEGCIMDKVDKALLMLANENGPWLYAPDQSKASEDRGARRSDILFALALAGFLADRIRH